VVEVSYIRKCGPEYVTGALRATTGKKQTTLKKPSLELWSKLLRTAGGVPHSPMRAVEYRFYFNEIPSHNTVHFIRHHVGVQPYVKSQRDDRNAGWSVPRKDKPQGEPISMMFDINVNSLLDMAKARLCNQADKDTKAIMKQMRRCLENGDEYDKEVAYYMRPPCKWYKQCFEFEPCGRLNG